MTDLINPLWGGLGELVVGIGFFLILFALYKIVIGPYATNFKMMQKRQSAVARMKMQFKIAYIKKMAKDKGLVLEDVDDDVDDLEDEIKKEIANY